MDARELKAGRIAEGAKITFANGYWLVPSESSGARHKVEVDSLFPSCTCEDFELRGRPCKHILTVRLFIERQKMGEQPETPAKPPPKVKRPTYPQDWPNYNAAQNYEKEHIQELLYDLCRNLPDQPPKGGDKGGRPSVRMADAAFAAVFKIYSTLSARRFMTDLRTAYERGYLSRPLCHNSVLKALENPALTPVLHDLIRESSLPLSAIETTFAVDSSGFCTSRFTRWVDVKYGVTREAADWVKCHLICGTKTNVVTAVEILDRHANDSPQLPALVKATARGFKVAEVSADKGYVATENFQTVADLGGTLYAPFKRNATGGIGGIYAKMFHYFSFNREDFLKHYHRRSNVESTFSMIKAKFRDHIRAKTDTAMVNETLGKVVCHNICCLVSAIYELGVNPVFWGQEPADDPDVLPMVRPN